MITYGTNPGMVMPIAAPIPAAPGRCGVRQVARLHGIRGRPRRSRISRSTWCSSAAAPTGVCPICAAPPSCCVAARSPQGVQMLVVPGSQQVKREAEAEGLRQGIHRRRRGVARVGLLDVPGDERRPGAARASTPSAPAIAISKAARASARARCWRAR